MTQPASEIVGPIPLMVAIWNTPHFTRTKRTLIASLNKQGKFDARDNCPTLQYLHYNGKTQAIGIHAGPQFNREFSRGYTVSFFEDDDYLGRELCLGPGVYPNLALWKFNRSISSIRFNEPFSRVIGLYENGENVGDGLIPDNLPPAATIPHIPLVVRLIDTDNYGPVDFNLRYPEWYRCLTLVEDAVDFNAMFGSEYDATTRSVIVQKGPDYQTGGRQGFEARLYVGPISPGGDIDQPANMDFGPNDDSQPPGPGLVGIAKGNWPSLFTPPFVFDKAARAMRIVTGEDLR